MSTPEIKMTVENIEGVTRRQVVDVIVEQELNQFDKFLTATFGGTQPMASFERAMVKSYIMCKLAEQIAKMPG